MARGFEWEATMKVFLECEAWMSMGIKRVVKALRTFAPPGVEIVVNQSEAELVIVHAVGNGQRQHWLEPQVPYAVVQYCLRTTELPNTKDWIPFWEKATAVWSYYDLLAKIVEDGNVAEKGINFFHAPLGVDPVFQPSLPVRKTFLVGTSGYIAETEGVKECYAVAQRRQQELFHLGPRFELGGGVTYATGLTDDVLADFWSQCSFVVGLRRIEGFELPVLEGLMCGARPIVFDVPHYTHWFGEFAELVPEVAPEELKQHLFAIMSKPVRPVTPAERSHVAQTFNWKTLATGFWEASL